MSFFQIKEFDKQFDLVLIAEHFDEGLGNYFKLFISIFCRGISFSSSGQWTGIELNTVNSVIQILKDDLLFYLNLPIFQVLNLLINY